MTKKRNRNRPKTQGAAAPYLNPFQFAGMKWPDDRTSQSATITSRKHYVINAVNGNAAATTTHNFGLLVSSYPEMGVFTLQSPDGTATVSDINTTGTGYYDRSAVPNIGAIKASPGLIRPAGIGVRITYEGTELQRGGKYFAGIAKQVYTPLTVPATGTKLSALSAVTTFRSASSTVGDLQNIVTNLSVARVSDGTFEAVWRPTKVPQYMAINNSNGGAQLDVAAGVIPPDGAMTILNRSAGEQGVEAGQAWLLIGVEGDTTAAASALGNPFSVDITWHWEYIPSDVVLSIVELTPSPYDPMLLAAIINQLELGPTGKVDSVMSSDTNGVLTRVDTVDYGELARRAGRLLMRGTQAYLRTRAPPASRQQRLLT